MRVSPMRIVVIGSVLAALPASTAAASTVSVSGSRVVFRAAPGEANDLSVELSATGAWLDDIGATLSLGPGCRDDGFGAALCTTAGAPTASVSLGDRDDQALIAGGTGSTMSGEAGNDELESGSGADRLDGGAGNDRLVPDGGGTPPGAGDVLVGGDGVDLVDYSDSAVPSLSVTLDGAADDGGPGERDLVAGDVENAYGARAAANTLIGDEGPNILRGWDGGDVLAGNGGDDQLVAGGGNDGLDGGAGNDELVGGGGDDRLTGGPGADSLFGDGPDATGNDAIDARDGAADGVACGPGTDTAVVDAVDQVMGDAEDACEAIDGKPSVAAPGRSGGGRPGLRSKRLRYRDGSVAVRVACRRGGLACRGRVRLPTTRRFLLQGKRVTVVIASTRYVVPAGRTRTVRVKVGRIGRWALRRQARPRVRVELWPRPAGTPVAARRTVGR